MATIKQIIRELDALDKQRSPGPWRKTHSAVIGGAVSPADVTLASKRGKPKERQIPQVPLVALCEADFGLFQSPAGFQGGKNARFIVALENAWPTIRAALMETKAG